MKTQKFKNKALELYIQNVPIYRICKQLNISNVSFYRWQKDGKWEQLKTEAKEKVTRKITEGLIEKQTVIAECATTALAGRLLNEEAKVKTPDLISIMKHGLEIVRPKQTTNNLNITKNENQSIAIQVNMPESVKELLEKELECQTST